MIKLRLINANSQIKNFVIAQFIVIILKKFMNFISNPNSQANLQFALVITSYSIHYTKLYELKLCGRSRRSAPAFFFYGKSGSTGTDWLYPKVANVGELQSQGVKGEVVVLYFEPLTTQNLKSSGFPEG